MRWLALILVIICFLCIGMVLHHFLVRCDLCHFFYLWDFFWPFGIWCKSMRVFDSGWMEYFGGLGLY